MEPDSSSSSASQASSQPLIIDEPLRSQLSSASSSQQSGQLSQQQPQPSQSADAAPKLQPTVDLQAINLQIAVAEAQLSQLSDQDNPVADLNRADDGQLEPIWLPQQGEEEMEPTEVIGTWGRGRNIRYRVRWSDGSISLNRLRELEERAATILENYRRENKRLATAKTHEKQRSGEAPPIPGRGRGRGRGPGSAGAS